MQPMEDQAGKLYHEFESSYLEVIGTGERFVKDKILRTWQIGKFAREKDHAAYYLYRYFPELYTELFQNEPILPQVPVWHHVVHHVFYLPEKWLNHIWWPQYGTAVVTYMEFYMERFRLAVERLESTYEIPVDSEENK